MKRGATAVHKPFGAQAEPSLAPRRAPGVTEKLKIRQAVLIGDLQKLSNSDTAAWPPSSWESNAYSSWSPPSTITSSSRTTEDRRWHSGEEQRTRPIRQEEKRTRSANTLKHVLSLGLRRKSTDVKAPSNTNDSATKGRRRVS